MPEAEAASRLLILAEPLLREGLTRVLGSSYRLTSNGGSQDGGV